MRTATEILTELKNLGVDLSVDGSDLRWRAPRGVMRPDLQQSLAEKKAAIMAMLLELPKPKDAAAAQEQLSDDVGSLVRPNMPSAALTDLAAGPITAVLIKSTVLDGALIWMVVDDDALSDHPDILRSGLPVFFFDEVEQLRGKTAAELAAIGLVKSVFPTGRVLQ